MQNLLEQLLTSRYRAKKGTELYREFRNKELYVTEVNESGRIVIGLQKGIGYSAWHEFKDLELINKPVETTKEQPVKSDLTGFKAKLLKDAYYALKYAEEDLLDKNRLRNIDPDEQCTIPSDSFEVKVDSISYELILNGKTCLDYDKL